MTRLSSETPCERASSWAALAPDGELSELERRLLDAHLGCCARCSRFAAQVTAVAAELRSDAPQPLPRPVSIPAWRRRRVAARLRAVVAATAVAVMALGAASRAPLVDSDARSFHTPRVVDRAGGDAWEQQALRDLRREAILAASAARRPARHFGNQPA